jgi:competence protein ComEC
LSEIRRLLPVALFSLGIALSPPGPSLRTRGLLAALAAALAILGAWSRASARRRKAPAACAWALTLFLAGGLVAQLEDRRYHAPLESLPPELRLEAPEGRLVRLTGRFENDPERVDEGRLRAIYFAESLEDRGVRAAFPARVQLTWPAPPGDPKPVPLAGAHASLTARLRLPRTFGNPGAFDMAEHLERRDMLALGWVKSARLIERSDAGHEPATDARSDAPDGEAVRAAEPDPASLAARVRRRFDRIFHRIAGTTEGGLTPEGSVLRASVLGGRTGLDPETERRLVASGVYHILAVSGLQVALLASVLLVVLRRTPAPPLFAVATAATASILYGAIVAPSASVGRAVAMAVLAAAARILHRRTPATALLALAALARLALRPSELGDPGFQLTFAATAGLLLFGPRLAPRVRARAGMGGLLAASLAAQAATWPLVAMWFHRIVPYGLASNLLAVPFGSAAVVLGVLLLPVDLVSARLADLVGGVALLALRGLLAVAEVPVEGTFLSFRVASPRPAYLVLAAAAIVGLALARRRSALALFGALGAVSLLVIVVDPWPRTTSPPWPAHRTSGAGARNPVGPSLEISLIDVGQGDAVLVRFDDGETMLVDGGGFPGSSFDVGAHVLVPELERRGISRIGRVVLTHAHEDHGGGLREVLRSLHVDELLVPDSPQGPLRAELEALARARGVRVVRLRRGYTIREGETIIRCLAPFPGVTDGPNADSLVLRLESGDRSALLTGDIVAATERRLLAAGLAHVDVLKVAHHGSDSSSLAELLVRLSPRVALISVGDANRFGHPSPRVVRRLREVRALVLRTDLDGAVRVDVREDALFAGSLQEERPFPWPGPPLRPRAP